MKFKVPFYVIFFCLSFGKLTFAQQIQPSSGKLYLLEFADLQDDSLKRAGINDLAGIRIWAKRISKFTGLELNDVNISNRFSRASVDSVVAQLRCGTQDVVIFFFTGHGFRLPSDNDDRFYPNFLFYNNEGLHQPLNLQTVHNLLRAKAPRMTITIGDMCNDAVGIDELIGHKGLQYEDAYRHLFLNYSGDLILCATSIGEVGRLTQNRKHGLLTDDFLNEFDALAHSGQKGDWSALLNKVKAAVGQHSDNKQTPYFTNNLILIR